MAVAKKDRKTILKEKRAVLLRHCRKLEEQLAKKKAEINELLRRMWVIDEQMSDPSIPDDFVPKGMYIE
jgi:vacuolar-type H+-ATPase subunit D/Vma8